MHYQRLLLRIVYASVYLLFYLLVLGLLLVTISDAISQSLRNEQIYNVWIITISLVFAVVSVGFIYAFRLYINKTALASIPKAWVPVERGEVKDVVYRAIAAGLDRSSLIASGARPRVDLMSATPLLKCDAKATRTAARELGATLPSRLAVWAKIEHPGWASPLSPDMPDLQYGTVLLELPNLVEGKALALAPTDPDAAGLLQRSPSMSLRGYVDHLAGLGVVPADTSTADFVSRYEDARFSNRPISKARFRELMRLFAEVLRNMRHTDLAAASSSPFESDIDNDAPMDTDPPSPRSSLSRAGTASTQGSRRRPGRHFARTRRPHPAQQASSPSLRSRASSSEAGSVIRLATREDPGTLPYVLRPSAAAGGGG